MDLGSDILLGSFLRSSELIEGDSYSRSETLTLGSLSDGPYWVFVITDALSDVFEENEGNNVRLSATAVSIVHPDLQVVDISLPEELNSGTDVTVGCPFPRSDRSFDRILPNWDRI